MASDRKAREAEAIEMVKVEEAELDLYIQPQNGEGPSRKDEIVYARNRYKEVLVEYKVLHLQKEEADARGNKKLQVEVMEGFRENYKCRKYFVQKLRSLGEKVEDRFVPETS